MNRLHSMGISYTRGERLSRIGSRGKRREAAEWRRLRPFPTIC